SALAGSLARQELAPLVGDGDIQFVLKRDVVGIAARELLELLEARQPPAGKLAVGVVSVRGPPEVRVLQALVGPLGAPGDTLVALEGGRRWPGGEHQAHRPLAAALLRVAPAAGRHPKLARLGLEPLLLSVVVVVVPQTPD